MSRDGPFQMFTSTDGCLLHDAWRRRDGNGQPKVDGTDATPCFVMCQEKENLEVTNNLAQQGVEQNPSTPRRHPLST